MRVIIGVLLATFGVILFIGYAALVTYFYIKRHSDDPADRYVYFGLWLGFKRMLLLGALGLSAIVLAAVGFEMLT